MFDSMIHGGRVIDGSGLPAFRADVGLAGDRVAAVGWLDRAEARDRIDATGLVVAPGLVDAHVHGDLALFADPAHEPAVRQGVTTYVIGQDGVAMAPASPATLDHMRRYTAGFNGNFPTPGLAWRSVGEYLSLFDRRAAINVACLVPNGNVRMEVMGLDTRAPTADELARMRRLVRDGMEEGAVGLSSGLDYIPSLYADAAELAALCAEVVPFGGVYVTHMRGYAPHTIEAGIAEVRRIGLEGGCAVHISHFNSLAEQAIPLMDAMERAGADVTFDLYCYLYGSSILGMIALPPEAMAGGVDATLARLRDPAYRPAIREGVANPRGDLTKVRLGSVPADEYRHLEGRTLGEAVELTKTPLADLIVDLLVATGTATNAVVPHHSRRTEADIEALMRDRRMMAGSDGIFVGGKPHPRGTGCFARYLGHYVRSGVWRLEEAVMKCSRHVARRHGLKDRGLIAEGMAADVIVFDPGAVRDRSTFDDGKALAEGMRHVFVNGEAVLRDGERTRALPGRGLRRG
ncbi:MAG TPA: D-aminoacylase [Gemmataceae bacterium]|nr:D-aminoacylase [Gemmataceae bacterium]